MELSGRHSPQWCSLLSCVLSLAWYCFAWTASVVVASQDWCRKWASLQALGIPVLVLCSLRYKRTGGRLTLALAVCVSGEDRGLCWALALPVSRTASAFLSRTLSPGLCLRAQRLS